MTTTTRQENEMAVSTPATPMTPTEERWIDDYMIRIAGRRFTVDAHVDRPLSGRTYDLTGPTGTSYIAVPAYAGDAHTFKVLNVTRSGAVRELRYDGNIVRLTDAGVAGLRFARWPGDRS